MSNNETLIARDLKHIWHPCSQMKDYQTFAPMPIQAAHGSLLELANGQQLIDAVSSWWCKSLGHNHPRLKAALLRQLEQYEHVMHPNTCQEVNVRLAEQLTALIPQLNKVFFAGDGSCCVEIALKMSLHAQALAGRPERTQFIALENAYHGETFATLSVSDLGLYRSPYQAYLFDACFIKGIPYVSSTHDPLWHDCSASWPAIETQLNAYRDTACALIVEPLLQGAGGMKVYSQDLLRRLRDWTTQHHVHFIADEIMTGIGRTGSMFACDQANIVPDFLCLSKGLTSGWLAFSAMLTRDTIYDLFFDDYAKGKAFMHSHTFGGNALGAAVAAETLAIFSETKLIEKTKHLGETMKKLFYDIATSTGKLTNLRQLGAMVAGDLVLNEKQQDKRMGYQVFQKACALGALLRPLGNTLYWLPPLNIDYKTLQRLQRITHQAIEETL